MHSTLHIAIVGGGAAGFFAAIAAKQNNPHADITIFEKNQKVLAKLEITGGGRGRNASAPLQGNKEKPAPNERKAWWRSGLRSEATRL